MIVQSVDLTNCSPHITVHGNTCTAKEDLPSADGTAEFIYLNVPPMDENGSYSISLISDSDELSVAGFGAADSVSRAFVGSWDTLACVFFDGLIAGKLGKAVINMDRAMGDDTLTLSYNPRAGTMHGAYNLEPAILLLEAIPRGNPTPLRPFVGLMYGGSFATIVNRPNL